MEPFSCPEFGLPLASGASRCSAPQPGTVYLLRYEPPNCHWAPSSTCWRLSFSSTCEPSSGAVVTEQWVRRRIQISGLNSTQLNDWREPTSRLSDARPEYITKLSWVGRVLRSTRHISGHLGDASFQPISCTDINKWKKHINTCIWNIKTNKNNLPKLLKNI